MGRKRLHVFNLGLRDWYLLCGDEDSGGVRVLGRTSVLPRVLQNLSRTFISQIIMELDEYHGPPEHCTACISLMTSTNELVFCLVLPLSGLLGVVCSVFCVALNRSHWHDTDKFWCRADCFLSTWTKPVYSYLPNTLQVMQHVYGVREFIEMGWIRSKEYLIRFHRYNCINIHNRLLVIRWCIPKTRKTKKCLWSARQVSRLQL